MSSFKKIVEHSYELLVASKTHPYDRCVLFHLHKILKVFELTVNILKWEIVHKNLDFLLLFKSWNIR